MKTYKVEVTEDYVSWHNENGELHREDDEAAIEWAGGGKCYYINGKRHRGGGLPAEVWADGTKFYWINGKLQRKNGAAIEWADGRKEYWIYGVELTEKEYNKRNNTCVNKVIEIDGVKYKLEKL